MWPIMWSRLVVLSWRPAAPAAPHLCRACLRRSLTLSRDALTSHDAAPSSSSSTPPPSPRSLADRFRALRQSQSVIYDMHEEQQMLAAASDPAADTSRPGAFPHQDQEQEVVVSRYGLQRGHTGVIDVEQVVELLRDEAMTDMCVLTAPAELAYVSWLVVCTGRSERHLLAAASTLRRLFKLRCRGTNQRIPHIEGREGDSSGDSGEWLAIDLTNVAVHFMLPHVREHYDIESLWALGAEYDLKAVDAARMESEPALMEEFEPLTTPTIAQAEA